MMCYSYPRAVSVGAHRLRCAPKADKEAGTIKRALEKETLLEELEKDEMNNADEVSDATTINCKPTNNRYNTHFEVFHAQVGL